MSDYRRVSLVTRFIEHLYTQLVVASNYYSLAGLQTKDHCNCSAHNFLASLVVSW
jgi:hypothetical protein